MATVQSINANESKRLACYEAAGIGVVANRLGYSAFVMVGGGNQGRGFVGEASGPHWYTMDLKAFRAVTLAGFVCRSIVESSLSLVAKDLVCSFTRPRQNIIEPHDLDWTRFASFRTLDRVLQRDHRILTQNWISVERIALSLQASQHGSLTESQVSELATLAS